MLLPVGDPDVRTFAGHVYRRNDRRTTAEAIPPLKLRENPGARTNKAERKKLDTGDNGESDSDGEDKDRRFSDDAGDSPLMLKLSQIMMSSIQLKEWARHYNAVSQEQQRSVNILPGRMPTLEAVNDMIEEQDTIRRCLASMKKIIEDQQHAAAADRQNRERGIKGPGDYDDDMSIYGDDMKNHGFSSEGKKRRGVR